MSEADSDREVLVVHDLTLPIDEARDTLRAIRTGEVDALVVAPEGCAPQVFILKGADHAHRVLFERLNEGALTIAEDTTILSANSRLAELLRRPLERVLGTQLRRFVAPADAGRFEALAAQARSGGSKGEISLEADGGARFTAVLSMSAVGEGEDCVLAVVVTDVGPLKEAQRALSQANDALEARVDLRTRELAAANEALRAEIERARRLEQDLRQKADALLEADRRKDEFVSMLAHELRNPLAPILTAAGMLRLAAPDVTSVDRYRSVIERQVKNLARLLDDLLDVSRITRGAISLRMQVLEISDVVRSAVEAARPLIESRGHGLSVALPAEPLRLLGDPARIEQVLVNLLHNAAKYTDRGGLIQLSTKASGGQVVIRVRDNGVGIGADLLPRIFNLFAQQERPLDRGQGGLGIGLMLVKNLVEMHGGRVEAESDGPGKGSVFVVRLPVALGGAKPDSSRHSTPAPPAQRAPGPRRRVLVVEDDPDTSVMLMEMLALWGHEVTLAVDGDEALRHASTFHPEVALVDVGLPGMDGYELARRLRGAYPLGRLLLVIGVTGYGQARDRAEGLTAGFDDYLVKPPEPEVLQALLERARPPS